MRRSSICGLLTCSCSSVYSRLSFNNTGISVAIAGTLVDTILRSAGDLHDEVFGDSTLAVGYAQAAYVSDRNNFWLV